ncbi:MAG: hypothetical protein CL908_04875 [Deltaproteobacteria bacterium]|nr:hypothetical protein [Deltaproteobacteria bacterium]
MALLVAATTTGARADEREQASDDQRLEELEEKVDILAEEVGRLESIFAVPEELELVSVNGLGPAASKVYKKDHGLSIGGYGEVRLRSFVNKDDDDEDDVFDALRAVLYVGYKWNDKWVVNSELEFEHAGSGGEGSVSTEFLTIDYLHREELNVRVGLLLVPMGFVNEIHEPTFFFGAERPEVERRIMPSTWRENGAGIFGRVADRFEYRFYVINGFDGSDFSNSGLRGGRQKGSKALSNDFAFVGRIDVDLAPGLLVGGSVYTGQSGREQDNTGLDGITRSLPDAHTTIYELHAQYKGGGASLRGLWTEAFIDEAGRLSRALDLGYTDTDPGSGVTRTLTGTGSAIGSRMQGWYVEAAYDVLPLVMQETRASLEPYFRFEHFDTQHEVSNLGYSENKSKDVDLYVAGLQWKPIENVVFKLDYRHFDPAEGDKSVADEVQALVGYVF